MAIIIELNYSGHLCLVSCEHVALRGCLCLSKLVHPASEHLQLVSLSTYFALCPSLFKSCHTKIGTECEYNLGQVSSFKLVKSNTQNLHRTDTRS